MRGPSSPASLVLALFLTFAANDAPAQFGEVYEIEILEIDAVVVDADGAPVEGLTTGEFEVLLDGKRVPISSVYAVEGGTIVEQPGAAKPAAPMKTYVAIFVDEMHLRGSSKKRAMDALSNFVTEKIGDHTSAMIIRWTAR